MRRILWRSQIAAMRAVDSGWRDVADAALQFVRGVRLPPLSLP
jgi:hypothetical protein